MAIELVISRYDRQDAETMTVSVGWNWSYPNAPGDWMGPLSGSANTLRGLAADIVSVFGEVS